MISNNLKNLFFHSLWYALLLFGFLGGYIHKIFMPILHDETLLYFLAVLFTLLYSVLVFTLFIKPTGRVATDISSNGSLISLNILAIAGASLIMILGRMKMEVVVAIAIGSIAQLIMLLLVLSFKEK